MQIWILSTCVPSDSEPCWPRVFPSEKEAYDAFEAAVRDEWEHRNPTDEDTGEALAFPDDVNEAHDILAENPDWGKWEVTSHAVDAPAFSKMLAMLDRIHGEMDAERLCWGKPGLTNETDLFNEIGCLIAEAKGEYTPETTSDPEWSKCSAPFWPRRTIDGRRTSALGQTWRRRGPDGKWQYKQDGETLEQWTERQW